MHVVRGALDSAGADRQVVQRLAESVASTGVPALRVWQPPKQVAFGRRDSAADGYEHARLAARERGYEPIQRRAGGTAVAYATGTVAFAYAVSTATGRGGIEDRYRTATERLLAALASVGAAVRRGEPSATFCPGTHSLRADGKVAGLAQRVKEETALVGGYVVGTNRASAAVADVLDPVYRALGTPFDPTTVGSVEAAGGPASAGQVADAIEASFVDERPTTYLDAETFLDRSP